MVNQPKFPLSAEMLNRIKGQIHSYLKAFATDEIPIDRIGAVQPGGRTLVEASSWPIDDAIEYFQNEGVGKRVGKIFKVLNMGYFGVQLQSLSVPVTFSADERIKADLAVMVDMYAQIYDIENRLRFLFHEKLKALIGDDYVKKLPRKVRERIGQEKARLRVFVKDVRSLDLQYTHFDDLKRILDNIPELISSQTARESIVSKLNYLLEARNYVAHNNLLLDSEVKEISEACGIVRQIVERESK